MPFCPKCKNEYVKGIKTCSECKCELVESLDDTNNDADGKPVLFGAEEKLNIANDFLKANGIKTSHIIYLEENEMYALMIDEKEHKSAVKMIQTFLRENILEEDVEETKIPLKSDEGEYVSAASKSEEHRSSGIILICVGIIGASVLILFWLGVFPIQLSTYGLILIAVLMVAMIAMGIYSLMSSKRLKNLVTEEEKVQKEIEQFMETQLTGSLVGVAVTEAYGEDALKESDEKLYFYRFEIMKSKIKEAFPNQKEAMLEALLEDSYDAIFSIEEQNNE